ncbi:MAG: ComEC/Rec2 family competence protein [Bacteroidales bacterium]|nr:ComEC/Rec2 family competence protein [Bacteroidales bacterium]
MLKSFFARRPIIFPLIVLILLIIVFDEFCPVVFLRNHYVKHLHGGDKYVKIVIKSSAKETKRKNYLSFQAEVVSIKGESVWERTCGDVKLYLPNEENINLRYGDTVSSLVSFVPISNFNTEFNYVKYQKHQRIYHSLFANEYTVQYRNKTSSIFELAYDCKQYLEQIILSSGLKKENAVLAAAMLLGDKTEADGDLLRSFRRSGLAHLLCVSGLHVMIIISFFQFLLSFIIPNNLRGFYIKRFILILLSWIIAFIVGLSPSCLRVAAMMSFIFLGDIFSVQYDRINNLFVTAFIFLVINPLLIFNFSFLLSFLSVAGLFILYPYLTDKLYNLLQTNLQKKIFIPILSNISASISTQVFCLPILIFYFRYFPVFFIFTNLIAIPLASVILVGLLVFLVFSSVPYFSDLAVMLLNLALDCLCAVAKFSDNITSMLF